MAVVQINPPGMPADSATAIAEGKPALAAEGYISSITIYHGGAAHALTPDATTGQVTVSAAAASHLVQNWAQFRLIHG